MKLARRLIVSGAGVLSLTFVLLLFPWNSGRGPAAENNSEAIVRGKELFERNWLPGDRRSHAGDGLGPLYNAHSCAACHHLGGVGGAGPRHMNVTVVSAFLESPGVGFFGWLFGGKPKPPQQPERAKLAEIHPALRTENSFPLHHFGTDKEFAKWRNELLGGFMNFDPEADGVDAVQSQFGFGISDLRDLRGFPISRQVGNTPLQLIVSERNAPSLFGAGLIDGIPERVLEEVAASQARLAEKSGVKRDGLRLPVAGRVARLKDGRAGRFGWKAQMPTLREFTFQACAIELGLEVPGFPQTAPPWKADYKAPGLDLTAAQCDALVSFVASLPPPPRKPAETEQHATEIAAGQKLFDRIGCAGCHQAKLGDVDGIYSDLLVHDMGPGLSDNGIYGGTGVPGQPSGDHPDPLPILVNSEPAEAKPPKFGTAPREWRTPPLWGLRDSAPYLHDGRAGTISAAVSFHGGEGHDSADRFFHLTLRERQQVELFLQSLAAPER